MEFIRRLSQQFGQFWQGVGPGRRLAIGTVVVACLALMLGVSYWAIQPDYRVLFSGLAPEDAAAVTAKLQTQGISYRLAGNGTTVLVPAEQVQQARLDLAAEGLPIKGGKGFELFDESPLGSTPFTQHVNYLRALQGELAKTIAQVEPVVHARVHISRPEPSPFVREQKPTTASVVLRLKQGSALSRSTASGIVALVARAVEGLSPENVTLLDGNGRQLSEPQQQGVGLVASQLEYRRSLETYLASKAEDMLAQLLGPGRAIIRVAADVNFQRLKETKETYSPEGKVLRSETTKTTKSTAPTTSGRGASGTTANLASRQTGGGSSSGDTGSNKEESLQSDYAVSKITQELEDKLGSLERLTIAAMVDLSKGEGDTGPTMTLNDVQDIIKQAVGFKTDRDEIKVSDVKMAGAVNSSAFDKEYEKIQQWQYIANLVRNGSLGLAVLVALGMCWLFLRRLRLAAPPLPAAAPGVPGLDLTQRISAVAERNSEELARALSAMLGAG